MRNKANKKEKISAGRLFAIAIISLILSATVCVCLFARLFMRSGKNKILVDIPDFVGKSIEEIDENEYFRINIKTDPIFSDEYPEGVIIAQVPSGNIRRVYHGEDVELILTVSLGKERHYMPDLIGIDCYEAACRLRELGAVVRFASIYSEDGEYDKVVLTSREVDAPLEVGDRVTIFVSRPKLYGSVKVGDYCSLPLSVACQRILRDGLTLGDVIYAPADDVNENFIIGQSLVADTFVKWGERIDITVATGNQEVAETETNGEE